MDTDRKTALVQRLLDQAEEITVRDSSDAKFKTWRNTVERTLSRVFGAESDELKQFKRLRFYYKGLIMYLGEDYSREHREQFDRDFSVAVDSLKCCKEELEHFSEDNEAEASELPITKVFISHSSKDSKFVEILIDLMELIGLSGDKIFCTPFEGYGIDLGEDFLETIKGELREETLVLFVLSRNFFDSPVCLCEMGATWVQTKQHIPILIPPFGFDDVKGVIPTTQGFKINDSLKLNLFKEKIETTFGFQSSLTSSSWERKRDNALLQIGEAIEDSKDSKK